MQFTITLPPRAEQLQFNRARWSEILADRGLAILPYRIETNGQGQIVMTPPASGGHSDRQGEIAYRIRQQLGGRTLPECPISTLDGIKVADVGWYSDERFRLVRDQVAFELAPEICVEVLSPSNTVVEMQMQRQLYFEAGAKEVWICDLAGRIHVYSQSNADEAKTNSILCPEFPA